MNEFLENIDLLISAIGFPILKEFITTKKSHKGTEYFLTARGSNARGFYTEEGFLILKRSTGPLEADNGKDEAYINNEDPDGYEHRYKRFIDAKHYKKGVPVGDIQNVLNRAMAERPDVVLIICSGDLSNATKIWIDKYIETTKPYFKIRFWQNKDLESIIDKFPELVEKHHLSIT